MIAMPTLTQRLANPTRFMELSGRRRRKLLADKLISAARTLACAIDMTARDLGHRARGLVAMVRPGSADAPDYVVEDRIRALDCPCVLPIPC